MPLEYDQFEEFPRRSVLSSALTLSALAGCQTVSNRNGPPPTTSGPDTPTPTEVDGSSPTESSSALASIELGESPTGDGLSAFIEQGGSYQVVDHGGTTGWATDKENGTNYRNYNAKFLYFDVADDIVHESEEPLSVTVEYYDGNEGSFTIFYDARGGDSDANVYKQSEVVERSGNDEWMQHTFDLQDAYFGDRMEKTFEGGSGADFRIGIGKLTGDNADVAISRVTIRRGTATTAPLSIDGTVLGNVFTDEAPSFSVTTSGDTIEWEVQDREDATIEDGSVAVDGETTLSLPLESPGYYELSAQAIDNEETVG
jgi:hypothetical protein